MNTDDKPSKWALGSVAFLNFALACLIAVVIPMLLILDGTRSGIVLHDTELWTALVILLGAYALAIAVGFVLSGTLARKGGARERDLWASVGCWMTVAVLIFAGYTFGKLYGYDSVQYVDTVNTADEPQFHSPRLSEGEESRIHQEIGRAAIELWAKHVLDDPESDPNKRKEAQDWLNYFFLEDVTERARQLAEQ